MAADDKPKPGAAGTVTANDSSGQDEVAKFVLTAQGKSPGRAIHQIVAALETKLNKDATAASVAKELLRRRPELDLGEAFESRLRKMSAEEKQVAAARLLLQVVRSKLTVKQFGKGGVVIGQIAIGDGKLSPEMVLAQMPISPEGYFAGEVGDMKKPIGFRAAGYEDEQVALDGKAGEVIDVGTVTLKPMAKEKAATLKGTVKLDVAERGPASMSLSLMVPRPNTPHNGYSPRRSWPKPTEIKLEADSSFVVAGLTPGDYYWTIQAKDHAQKAEVVAIRDVTDKGVIQLRTTDLGFYIGKKAPPNGELPWEKDFDAAITKAAADKRPMMVMMTATWCGPCKALEGEVLNNAWVKHFLSGFVIVKAYEDKAVEAKYPMNGYPTLVFLDSAGKEMHRTVGYQPSTKFLSECVKGMRKLKMTLPTELQALIDKKVIDG